jgi:hypothetical protein
VALPDANLCDRSRGGPIAAFAMIQKTMLNTVSGFIEGTSPVHFL